MTNQLMVEVRYLRVQQFIRQAIGTALKEISPKLINYCLGLSVGLQENMLQTVTFVERYL